MLAALEAMVFAVENGVDGPFLELARAAIAKARGV